MEVVTLKYDSKNPNKKLFHLSYYKLNALFFAYVTGGEKGSPNVLQCITQMEGGVQNKYKLRYCKVKCVN